MSASELRVPHVSNLRHGTLNTPPANPTGRSVLLYDGECGLCQYTVRWLLRHDPEARLLFAAQQQALAAEILARHALDTRQLNSAVLVSHFATPREILAIRSDSILGSLTLLGGHWALLARVARLIPRPIRDAVYRWLAHNRIRLFGTAELCALPTPAERARFLDV